MNFLMRFLPGLLAERETGLLADLATTLARAGFLTEAVRTTVRDLADLAGEAFDRGETRLMVIGYLPRLLVQNQS